MNIPSFIAAVLFASTAIGTARADALQPIVAQSIDLGEVSGVAYYTVEPAGYRVVATLVGGETGTPVRFEAILTSGQSVMLSTPRGVGGPPNTVEIRRQDNQMLVHASAVTN